MIIFPRNLLSSVPSWISCSLEGLQPGLLMTLFSIPVTKYMWPWFVMLWKLWKIYTSSETIPESTQFIPICRGLHLGYSAFAERTDGELGESIKFAKYFSLITELLCSNFFLFHPYIHHFRA